MLHSILHFQHFHSCYIQYTTLGARGFFFRSEMSGEAAIVILPREKKKSLWTRQLQTSLPCDFETKHLTKPVFEGSLTCLHVSQRCVNTA